MQSGALDEKIVNVMTLRVMEMVEIAYLQRSIWLPKQMKKSC